MPRKIICLLCLVILFIFLTSLFTFPLVYRLNSAIPGFGSTDEPFVVLWHFWWEKYSAQQHLNRFDANIIAVPFGFSVKNAYVYWGLGNRFLSLYTNPLLAYNLQIIASFVLSGIIGYFLAFYVFGNALAAVFSSLVFTYCPYHMVRSWQHLGLAHIQWLPLCLLAFLYLYHKRSTGNFISLTISFVLLASFDLYYAYFMGVISILSLIYFCIYDKAKLQEKINFIFLFFAAVILSFVLISPELRHIFSEMKRLRDSGVAQGIYGYVRPFHDLFEQSARPLSYLLPATFHPLLGRFTENFIGTSYYGDSFTEHTLYLGWVSLVLAGLALWRWLKAKEKDFFIGFFVFLALVAWLFSQPPWWDICGFKIYMPAFFMYKLLPMFRAYSRFGIIVMLAVAVLAGFGLKGILESYRTKRAKFTVGALLSVIAMFEFWTYPPFKVIDVSRVPDVYSWLKGQKGNFVIAEYPLDTEGPNELYKFYQTKHHKAMINGTSPATSANKLAKTMAKLSEPNTVRALRQVGVKYALVHRQAYLDTGLLEAKEELESIAQNPLLKKVVSFPAQGCPDIKISCTQESGPIDVYELR